MAWWLTLVVVVVTTWWPSGWLAGRFAAACFGDGDLQWWWSRPIDTPEGRTLLLIAKVCGWVTWLLVLLGVALFWIIGRFYGPEPLPQEA